MRLATLVLLAAAALAVSGCVPMVIGAGAAAYSTLEDRRSTGTQIDDESIEVRSANRITDRFGDSVHINITSFSHMALVTGEVPDARAKDEVDKIVRAVPTVRGVTNDLQVAGLSSMGSRTNDSYLTSKVKARLLDSQNVSPLHVKVVTESGVVYLLGIVTEAEADEAVELARTTGGVRKVVKVFEYCKPTDEICKPRSAPPPTSTRQRS
jgi:osmotically-inducible protein OsmY